MESPTENLPAHFNSKSHKSQRTQDEIDALRAIRKAKKDQHNILGQLEEQIIEPTVLPSEELREKSLEEARNQFKTLIEVAEVAHIVCVDNNYSPARDTYSAALGQYRELFADGDISSVLTAESPLGKIDSNQPLEFQIQEFENLWNAATREEHEQITSVLGIADAGITLEQGDSVDTLGQLCQGLNASFTPLSFKQWESKKNDYVERAETEKTLFLFDRNPGDESELFPDRPKEDVNNIGLELMDKLCEQTQEFSRMVLCGLISITLDETDEKHLWRDSQGVNLEPLLNHPHRCVPIPRKCLASEETTNGYRYSEFVRRIKFTLLAEPFHKFLEKSKGLYDRALTDSHEEVAKLSIYDLDYLLFQKSAKEGLWEPDTLFRIVGIYYLKKARELAKEDEEIPELLESIRPLSDCLTKEMGQVLGETEQRRLGHLELYDDAHFINQHHLAIQPGDIFEEITNGALWLLLDQPCDVMVRFNPDTRKGGQRKSSLLTLVKVSTGPGTQKPSFGEELPYFTKDNYETAYVNWQNQTPIESWVLDMSVFNKDGLCTFSPDAQEPKGLPRGLSQLHQHLKKRLGKLLADHKTMSEAISSSNMSDVSKQLILDNLGPTLGTVKPIQKQFENEGRTFTVTLKRVGRISAAKTAALLESFHRHNSRPAWDMDLGKTDKPTEADT